MARLTGTKQDLLKIVPHTVKVLPLVRGITRLSNPRKRFRTRGKGWNLRNTIPIVSKRSHCQKVRLCSRALGKQPQALLTVKKVPQIFLVSGKSLRVPRSPPSASDIWARHERKAPFSLRGGAKMLISPLLPLRFTKVKTVKLPKRKPVRKKIRKL